MDTGRLPGEGVIEKDLAKVWCIPTCCCCSVCCGAPLAGASFVIAGDHNADPADGASEDHAIQQLLQCSAINASFTSTSEGGKARGNRKPADVTPPETKTSDFDLRVDSVLPSRYGEGKGREEGEGRGGGGREEKEREGRKREGGKGEGGREEGIGRREGGVKGRGPKGEER